MESIDHLAIILGTEKRARRFLRLCRLIEALFAGISLRTIHMRLTLHYSLPAVQPNPMRFETLNVTGPSIRLVFETDDDQAISGEQADLVKEIRTAIYETEVELAKLIPDLIDSGDYAFGRGRKAALEDVLDMLDENEEDE